MGRNLGAGLVGLHGVAIEDITVLAGFLILAQNPAALELRREAMGEVFGQVIALLTLIAAELSDVDDRAPLAVIDARMVLWGQLALQIPCIRVEVGVIAILHAA